MQLDNVVLQALVKAISLGYLLGAVALSLAALYWRLLGRFTAPAHRANAFAWLVTTVFTINSLLTVGIYAAVVSGMMKMTTNLFHRLMYGGWAAAFTTVGIMLLGLSLIISWQQWRRGQISREQRTADPIGIEGLPTSINGMDIVVNRAVPTISLVGAWRQEIWINPLFWRTLSPEEQRLALMHEQCHQRRRDNQRRLLLEGITALFFVLPWVRHFPDIYEQDCELAVDDFCRQQPGAGSYAPLVAKAVDQLLPRRMKTVVSELSARQLSERLKILTHPRTSQPGIKAVLLVTAAILASQAVTGLLLAFSVSRCLLTCYLGY